MKEIS